MSKPADMSPDDSFKHGTRARYVTGCHCVPCTKSNLDAYHERQERAKQVSLKLKVRKPVTVTRPWKAPDGIIKERIFKNGCPGIGKKSCATKSVLRKDSTGGICRACRSKLVWNGLVSAQKAKDHLLGLSEQGVGKRVVGALSGVALTVIMDIKSGKKKQVRADTEKAIMKVDFSHLPPQSLAHVRRIDRIAEARELSFYDIQSRIGQSLRGCE